jgi:predicted transcriptional regulator
MEKAAKKSVNMDIDAEVWRKVGMIAALEGSTKKAVVEAAIKDFANKYGKQLIIEN